MPTEPANKPVFRELNLSAEIKRAYEPNWNAPEVSYRFSNDREFKLRTGDSAIYVTSPDF